jgi:thymidylate kinase
VIAISGLDGAGKSSQAGALTVALRQLGFDATVTWSRFGWDDALAHFAVPLKRALTVPADLALSLRHREPRAATAVDGASAAARASSATADPIGTLRERSPLLTHAWTCVIALFNARELRRLVRPQLRRRGIVICDRYTLDSIVAMRCGYGPSRRFRLQRWLIATLSPTPRRSFLLDVAPATARARKPEHQLDWLAGHAALYREECARLGVIRLNGERSREELCAEIATEVWYALR